MKILNTLLIIAASSVVSAAELPLQKQLILEKKLIIEARGEVKKLGGGLKKVLKTQMKTRGPVAAVEACNIEAPQIAEKINSGSDWKVGRTSLKIRNSANAADPWEDKVLQYFEKQRKAGANPASLEFSEIVASDTGREFRYMKAIGTKKICLACHGADIAGAVSEKIKLLYPQDKAIGYAEGELRGAFTLSKATP